ncbi:hypothetical protein WA588_004467, partial [Blastocystis sp. NMH]
MFKAKRHRGTIRKVEKEEGSDSGVNIDVEKIRTEQMKRKEQKLGLSTEQLLKGTGVMIDPLAQRVSDSEESATSSSKKVEENAKSSLDEKKLLKYINDESAIFKPEGLVIPEIGPEPVTVTNEMKEVESTDGNHYETMEEIAKLKRKMTKELKRERREVFESK